jgi:hypothetical protein
MMWVAALIAAAVSLAVAWRRFRRAASRQRRLMLLCQRAGLEFAPWDMNPGTA